LADQIYRDEGLNDSGDGRVSTSASSLLITTEFEKESYVFTQTPRVYQSYDRGGGKMCVINLV